MTGPDVPGRAVIELEFGILVYPPRPEPEQAGGKRRPARWRAVWYEDGERQQCQSVSEEKLAAELEKVKVRLEADAPNMRRPGADLIAYYLDSDRLPPDGQWSRKHAHTQRRLCERFAAPVIDAVACQDIKMRHTQKIVNAAPTAGEGTRAAGMISALVDAGIEGGYLVNPRLAKVHWQAAGRQLPPAPVSVAGESALWVDPAEIPAEDDIAKLGRALADGLHGERDELMAQHRRLQRAAVGRADRPDHRPDRRRRPGDHGGPKGHRGRRAPLYRGTQGPQVPQDDLPTPHPRRLPPRRAARRSHRAGPRRAGRRHQPARAGLPLPEIQAMAVLQLQPQRPQARLRRSRLARRYGTAGGPGTACGTYSAPPPCSPGSSTPPTCPAWPDTPTSAPPFSCTSAPPPASSTAHAKQPNNSPYARLSSCTSRRGSCTVSRRECQAPLGVNRGYWHALPMSVSTTTHNPGAGILNMAAPSGAGGTPAAVTDDGHRTGRPTPESAEMRALPMRAVMHRHA